MIAEFFAGVRMLLHGFGLWRRRPGLMLLGLVPALLAMVVIVALLIPYGFALGPITGWLTPFAENWDTPWRMLMRGAIGVVLFLAAAALSVATFTALSLAIGSPFYDRIWREVETELGGVPESRNSFAATLGESLRLVVFGVLNAGLVLLLGLIPVAGTVIAAITGLVLSGRLLARELSGRSFDARAIDRKGRGRLIRLSRARTLGFGVATQLCFMVPFGALLTMPAAVAGSTFFANSLIERAARADPRSGIVVDTVAFDPRRSLAPETLAPAPETDA